MLLLSPYPTIYDLTALGLLVLHNLLGVNCTKLILLPGPAVSVAATRNRGCLKLRALHLLGMLIRNAIRPRYHFGEFGLASGFPFRLG
jgi:hypothetical protein